MIKRMRRMNEAMDKMMKTSKRPRMLLDQYDEHELKLVAHYQNSQYSVFLYSGINPEYPEDGLSFNLLGIGEVDSRDGYVMEFDTDMTYAVEKVLNNIVKDIDKGATMDDILSDYERENARFNDYTPAGFKMNESYGRRSSRLSESYNRRMMNESIDNITKADIREFALAGANLTLPSGKPGLIARFPGSDFTLILTASDYEDEDIQLGFYDGYDIRGFKTFPWRLEHVAIKFFKDYTRKIESNLDTDSETMVRRILRMERC